MTKTKMMRMKILSMEVLVGCQAKSNKQNYIDKDKDIENDNDKDKGKG